MEFNLPFGKRPADQKRSGAPPPPGGPENAPTDNTSGGFNSSGGVPVDFVISMKNQGLSSEQIVQSLQSQGYDPHQVYEALNQVSLKSGVDNVPPQYFDQGEYPNDSNPIQPQQVSSGPSFNMDRVEEITEAIVDEKWKELTKNMERLNEWKDKVEHKLTSIEQQIEGIKENFATLHQGVLGKVGEYDKNIGDLGVEIKAMEKVFKEVLPTLTDNVNELSSITQSLKKS